jgi:hypothetical protein
MRSALKANWGDNETANSSVEELDRVVTAIRKADQSTLFFLEADNGKILVVGIGHDQSVLTGPNGVSFHRLGDPERKGYLVFLCRDQLDEFMLAQAPPGTDVLET